MDERVPAGDLGDPQCSVTEFLELGGQFLRAGRGHGVERAGPQADAREGQALVLAHVQNLRLISWWYTRNAAGGSC